VTKSLKQVADPGTSPDVSVQVCRYGSREMSVLMRDGTVDSYGGKWLTSQDIIMM
jgi:hypothetical protein